ncbi:MAG: Uma2 family endonuclease [Cyanophyceae cyanobacterium]
MVWATYKWSIDKWHELVDSGVLEGQKVELLEGDIVEMSPEGVEHSFTNESIVIYLRNKLSGLAHVRESHPITLNNSEPEPDIAIVRLPLTIYRTHHPYAEDIYWLIEVSQRTLKKDLEEKVITYARNRISEYWVIDLKNKQLIIHTQPSKDKYLQMVKYHSGTVTPQAFPHVEIAIDKLLLY